MLLKQTNAANLLCAPLVYLCACVKSFVLQASEKKKDACVTVYEVCIKKLSFSALKTTVSSVKVLQTTVSSQQEEKQ